MKRFVRRMISWGSPATVAFLAAAVILAIGGWQIASDRADALTHAESTTKILARTLAQHAQRTIETVDLALDTIVRQIQDGRDVLDVARSFHASAFLDQTLNIAITDASGHWIANTALLDNTFDSSSRNYFAELRTSDSGHVYFDTPIRSLSTGRIGIPLVRRINHADGTFAGVVVATLNPDYFAAFYASVRIGEQGTITLWSEDGRILVRYPRSAADLTPVATVAKSFEAGPSGFLHSVSPVDGIDRLFAFEHVGRYPVVASVGEAQDDALAPWRRHSREEAAVLLASAAVLAGLGVILERRRRATLALEARSREALQARTEAETRLRHRLTEANRLLRLAEEIAQVGHWRLEVPSQALTWSAQVFRIHGLDPETYTPTVETAILRYHEDDRAEIRRRVGEAIQNGTGFSADLRILQSDGSPRQVVSRGICEIGPAGEVQAVFGTFMDVTEARRAEAELAASERRYRILTETSSDVVTQLDLRLRRTYVSPSCRRLLGYEPEEMLGVRPSASIHPDEAAAVRELAATLARGEIPGDRATVTYRTRHKTGRWVWVEAILTLLRDAETGRPSSLICSLRDVTERQRTARHLERAATLAEQAARAKAEFLANTSHELRTPLAGIIGMQDVLLASPNLSAEHRRQVRLASAAGRSLLTIVNDILDLSKIDAGQLELEAIPFDADALFADCRALACASLAGKPVAVEATFEPMTLGALRGDPTRIRQITNNLLGNAVKFTADGHVSLDVRIDPTGRLMRVTVTDTGIGLPSDDVDSLFDRFTQADASMSRRFGGTGLGLAICKHLVGLMGGRIGAERRPQGGAVFWFELPVTRATELAEAPPAAIVGRPCRILLAEDNALSAEIVVLMLTARGHSVVRVENGAEAVAAVAGEAFDIVLMDMQMPILDGLGATGLIRQGERAAAAPRALPIVGLTANASRDDAQRCRAAGMDAHVAKPIDWSVLRDTIHRLTDRTSPIARPAAEPGRASAPPVLDLACLEDLSGIIGPRRVTELLASFADELAARSTVIAEMDLRALADEAHRLVSASGQLGLSELSAVCAAISRDGREGRVGEHAAQLRGAALRARDAIERTALFKAA